MTMQSKPEPPRVSVFAPQNQPRNSEPEVPTMTSASILEPLPPRDPQAPPEELAEDIVAKPLTMPEFTNDIQPYLKNQGLAARWIFTDRRRYMEAKAQGWRNCTAQDLKPGFGTLNPFSEEGGTKFINGDLILMVMDRQRYLGALRDKHERAWRLSSDSRKKARLEMGPQIAAINRQRQQMGQPPVMEEFEPSDAEMARVGQHRGKPDTGRLADINKEGK